MSSFENLSFGSKVFVGHTHPQNDIIYKSYLCVSMDSWPKEKKVFSTV
jgi:hypothetical protein